MPERGALSLGGIMQKRGFTLIEIIVALFIVAFLSASVSVAVGKSSERAAIVTTLSEMNTIKDVVQDRFYPDLGLIPEDTDEPATATRFLCLSDDGGAGNPLYDEMRDFVGSDTLMTWDKRLKQGWQGPYLEPDGRYYDTVEMQYYPVLTDAWKNPYQMLAEFSQDRATARIVSFGRNGRDDGGSGYPVPDDIGDDVVVFLFGGGIARSPLDN